MPTLPTLCVMGKTQLFAVFPLLCDLLPDTRNENACAIIKR